MALNFIKRLTQSNDYDDSYDDEEQDFRVTPRRAPHDEIEQVANAGIQAPAWESEESTLEEEEGSADGELPIDMYETDDSIVIQAFVAGVRPDDLDIMITRDSVTIRGSRLQEHHILDEDYGHKELFWGSFARKVTLPDEVVIDEAEAHERHGLLQLTLPRLDKHRSARLNIKSSR